ncbi:MAG: hypothetical protein ACOYS2_02630 [Patescibacteria group bacterium]
MLAKHILNTIVYYDVMNYPLTIFEIWKHLITLEKDDFQKGQVSLGEVLECLEKDTWLRGKVGGLKGFFFLRGREDLIEERLIREKISFQKIKKTAQAVSWMRFLPFLRQVFVAGRVAMKNAKSESDLDVIIIAKSGRIFLARLLAVLGTHLLGKRRHGSKVSDRICLNHFWSENGSPETQDLFSCHEYSFILPIWRARNSRFNLRDKNRWMLEYKPNYFFEEEYLTRLEDTRLVSFFRTFGEKFLDWEFLEEMVKKIQIKKIRHNPKSGFSGGRIIYSDEELAFWPEFESQGPKVWENFSRKLEKIERS